MMLQRLLPGVLIGCLLLMGIGGLAYTVQQRMLRCAYVPILADERLPNASLEEASDGATLPAGWRAAAPGVKTGMFALDGDNRSIHLMGIANYVETPPISVQPGQVYCFVGHAITDSEKGSPTRVRISFHWHDAQGQPIASDTTAWQPVVLWQEEAPAESWSRLDATFQAPASAKTLRVRVHPASDDRVYLDVMHVRQSMGQPPQAAKQTQPAAPAPAPAPAPAETPPLHVAPWPQGHKAALSFTFDWETTMAGLIHSRSVGDPYADDDPQQRGMRMREGITTTMELFRPHGIKATYYTAGYTFLLSNTHKIQFMGNPTYTWATTENRWTTDRWQTTPWFSPDPYGTVQSHPSWYFGDLVPIVRQAGHDIQSHTFSHFYGGFVRAEAWHDDLATWNRVAAARSVPAARSLAFPWSSSGGMSYADWDTLQAAGITSVTRLSDQSQYNLFPRDGEGLIAQPRCIPLPGHEAILACPDFYLTPDTAKDAIRQIQRTMEVGGFVDLWAHTEEVITSEQQAAWEQVVAYAASQPDLWIAPLSEVADWQQAIAQVRIEHIGQPDGAPFTITIANESTRNLSDVALYTDYTMQQARVDGNPVMMHDNAHMILVDIQAGETLEVQVWQQP
jgi:peptidoglycan/xylan/chitin deacetylase (PgdA/CDA1 family)